MFFNPELNDKLTDGVKRKLENLKDKKNISALYELFNMFSPPIDAGKGAEDLHSQLPLPISARIYYLQSQLIDFLFIRTIARRYTINDFFFKNPYLDRYVKKYNLLLHGKDIPASPIEIHNQTKHLEATFFMEFLDRVTCIKPYFTTRALTYICGNLVLWLRTHPSATKEQEPE